MFQQKQRLMRIGLTFDLKTEYLAKGFSAEAAAEFDSEDTIAALEQALQRNGHETQRIGSFHSLMDALQAGKRWDLVFNICEGVNGAAREAQVPLVLDAFGIPYTFSDPAVLTLCLHKGWTKAVLSAAGVPTAPFMTLPYPSPGLGQRPVQSVRGTRALPFPFPVFVKPVAEGTGKGIAPSSIVHTADRLDAAVRDLWARFAQPVLVEPYLPGREFTAALTGEGDSARAEGCLEISLRPDAEPGVYSYANKADYAARVDYRLCTDATAQEAMRVALDAYRVLGCRDAGRADLRCDAQGRVMLMEMNPLAGLHPVDSDLPILWRQLGRSYDDLIGTITAHASARIKTAR